MTRCRHQHDPRAPEVLLRAVPVRNHPLKSGTVAARELEIGSFMHPTYSDPRVRSGIIKRIETPDFIH